MTHMLISCTGAQPGSPRPLVGPRPNFLTASIKLPISSWLTTRTKCTGTCPFYSSAPFDSVRREMWRNVACCSRRPCTVNDEKQKHTSTLSTTAKSHSPSALGSREEHLARILDVLLHFHCARQTPIMPKPQIAFRPRVRGQEMRGKGALQDDKPDQY